MWRVESGTAHNKTAPITGCCFVGAVTGIRTRDLHLTKVVLYRLSHNSVSIY